MSAPTSVQLDALLSRLKNVRKQGGGYIASCSAHADSTPSLSVGDGETCVLVYCWAGCQPRAIVEAVGLTMAEMFYAERPAFQNSPSGAVSDPKKSAPANRRGMFLEAEMAAERLQTEIRVLHELRDVRGWAGPALAKLRVGWDGERLTIPVRDKVGNPHDVLRYDPFKGGRFKILAGQGRSRLPWPAPEGLKAAPGWPYVLVEGEGTAIALASLGIVATALPGAVSRPTGDIGRPGSFKGPGWHPSWAGRFPSRVCLIPDCDDSGHTLMRTAHYDLQRLGVHVVYLNLLLAKGEDVGDVLRVARNGQARKEAKALIRACVECADRRVEQLPEALEMLAAWRTFHSP